MFPSVGPIIRSWLAFQLIYARGMFRIVADTMQEFADVSTHICVGNVSARPYLGVKVSSFNSYMCEECFAYGDNTLDNAVVSNHICVCVGNVSLHYAGGVAAVLRVFQFIYVRGMFHVMLAFGISPAMASIHICVGNVSGWYIHRPAPCRGFDSYMCGGCFARRRCPGCRWSCFNSYMCGECFCYQIGRSVSTHICAGNVSLLSRQLVR